MNELDRVYIKSECLDLINYKFCISPEAAHPDKIKDMVINNNKFFWVLWRNYMTHWNDGEYQELLLERCELIQFSEKFIDNKTQNRSRIHIRNINPEYLISIVDVRNKKIEEIL